jgi:mono/diheme cytochrome c family protein
METLFPSQAALEPDAQQEPRMESRALSCRGLGHCGSCHTPRNALGGEKKGSNYAGGVAEGWNAPLVSAHQWTVDQLAEYLSTG